MVAHSETATRKTGVDLSWDHPDFDREQKSPRDWKKLFLVVGLGGLSWVATYVGMLELIEANMGELPLVHKGIIGFSVAMLMVMVVWLLDQMFSEGVGWFTKSLYAAGYVFLTIISVGFGFGFYWKVLESRSEASRSAESAVGQVQTSLHAAMTRLEQLQGTLDSLTTVSAQKAETERASGASCPNSKPGDGPRRKMRDDDAARFKFASDFVKGRVGAVKSDMAALDGDLAKIVKDDKSTIDKSGTRNEFLRNLGRKLDLTVTGFNAFRSDPQLKQIRIDLNERADKVTFVDTKGGTYTCPDSQLTTALKGVVRAIDELPSLEKPKIAAVEGSEAVIEAFRRLTATFYGALAFKMPPSPEELRELQKKAVQSVENAGAQQAKLNALAEQAGLAKRDYVPLAVALFVDLCLLLVSMQRGGPNRLQNLVPKMRAAERGPVIQILSRFNEIHRDAQIRENFEVFRHVVFDFHGDYYAAVPLNAPYRPNPRNGHQRQGYGVSDAHDLLQEAHLLANLFASFEKEKIFTRVYSPLLSTKTVQKRLRRQGSKFANAEAFRIYRFRDGAWSDIILGAVMGAARRVEAEKRRRRVEEEIFAREVRREPAFGAGRGEEPDAPERDSRAHEATASVSINGQPPYPYVVGGSTYAGTPGGAAAGGWAPPAGVSREPVPARGYEPAPRTAPPSAPWPAARVNGPVEEIPLPRPVNTNTSLVERRAQGESQLRERDGDASPAPVAPSPSHPIAENVVMHPAVVRPGAPSGTAASGGASPTPVQRASEGMLARALEPIAAPSAEPSVMVAAVRETVTYTLPVSEAALPRSLFGATEEAVNVAEHGQELRNDATAPSTLAEAPAMSLPPPALSSALESPALAPRASHEAVDQIDPRAMALRLRPEQRDV